MHNILMAFVVTNSRMLYSMFYMYIFLDSVVIRSSHSVSVNLYYNTNGNKMSVYKTLLECSIEMNLEHKN